MSLDERYETAWDNLYSVTYYESITTTNSRSVISRWKYIGDLLFEIAPMRLSDSCGNVHSGCFIIFFLGVNMPNDCWIIPLFSPVEALHRWRIAINICVSKITRWKCALTWTPHYFCWDFLMIYPPFHSNLSDTDSIGHFIWVQIRIRLFQSCISRVNCCRDFFQRLFEPLHSFHCFWFVLVLYL